MFCYCLVFSCYLEVKRQLGKVQGYLRTVIFDMPRSFELLPLRLNGHQSRFVIDGHHLILVPVLAAAIAVVAG